MTPTLVILVLLLSSISVVRAIVACNAIQQTMPQQVFQAGSLASCRIVVDAVPAFGLRLIPQRTMYIPPNARLFQTPAHFEHIVSLANQCRLTVLVSDGLVRIALTDEERAFYLWPAVKRLANEICTQCLDNQQLGTGIEVVQIPGGVESQRATSGMNSVVVAVKMTFGFYMQLDWGHPLLVTPQGVHWYNV